jgi:hypothetical protein
VSVTDPPPLSVVEQVVTWGLVTVTFVAVGPLSVASGVSMSNVLANYLAVALSGASMYVAARYVQDSRSGIPAVFAVSFASWLGAMSLLSSWPKLEIVIVSTVWAAFFAGATLILRYAIDQSRR